MLHRSEIQFVYPNPKGSKLIFFTPFRAGVNEEIQFANLILNAEFIKTN
jgi:hypothetical protein